MPQWKPSHAHEHLKEFVGHTPIQIFVGAVLGIIIAIIYNNIIH
ncbi:MAG: divergent PAP2 family protein [Lachnospiraceae bacterium]